MEENKQKLKQAFREAAAMEFADLNTDTLQPDFSDEFLSDMETVLQNTKKRRNPATRLLRCAACFAVIVLLTGVTVSAVCGDGFAPILEFFGMEGIGGYIDSHGYSGETMTDENGFRYIPYTGGEMCIPYQLKATGLSGQEIGVLMFIDGQIQPYKTGSDDSLQYMHIFTPNRHGISEQVIFTPVTGSAGDQLMISFMAVIDPGVHIEGILQDMDWASSRQLYLQYEADPPEPVYPETLDRVTDLRIMNEEDVGLTGGWSEEELSYRTGFQFYVNDRYFDSISAVDASEPLRLKLTLWGTDKNAYGVVFFVNHQPISVAPDDMILVRNMPGEKVVVEVEVDISDLSGDILVYAMLTGREGRIDTNRDLGWVIPTRSYFFVCE